MRIQVLYFAAARERAGVRTEPLEIAGGRVHDVLDAVAQKHPELRALFPHLRVAVNQDFASGPDAEVPDGAEVALIPPVAGGAGCFKVVDRALSLDEVVKAVSGDAFGGVVTFSGAVRNETKGKRVTRLEYEAYGPMAEKKLAEIGLEAAQRWPGARVAIVHRVGVLTPGDLAVVIAAAAPHRAEAFEACRFAIEQLKKDVPIWKKEKFEDGEEWVGLGP